MFDGLRGGQHSGVTDGVVLCFFDDSSPSSRALDGGALFAGRFLADDLKHVFQPSDLPFGLFLVLGPFQLVTLREVGDAFVHAKTIASELGAGTPVHVGRFDLVEFAVVLEPAGTAANGAARVLRWHGGAP